MGCLCKEGESLDEAIIISRIIPALRATHEQYRLRRSEWGHPRSLIASVYISRECETLWKWYSPLTKANREEWFQRGLPFAHWIVPIDREMVILYLVFSSSGHGVHQRVSTGQLSGRYVPYLIIVSPELKSGSIPWTSWIFNSCHRSPFHVGILVSTNRKSRLYIYLYIGQNHESLQNTDP